MSWRFYTRLLTFPWEQPCKSRRISHSRTPPPVHQSVSQCCRAVGPAASLPLHWYSLLVHFPLLHLLLFIISSAVHFLLSTSLASLFFVPNTVCVCVTTLDILSPSGTRKDQIILCRVNHSRTIIIMCSQWDPSLSCPLNRIKNSQLDKDQTLTKRDGGLATKWVHCP